MRFGSKVNQTRSHFSKMAQSLHARGPDAGGFFVQDGLAFGHRRLSILDLSPNSQQPMMDSELGLGIVFNGCIYNFRELRGQLQQRGYQFFSDGDTEVILKSYHAWGPRCVERFKGMFAFAIWERASGRVTLVRDRLGIKPLYYTDTPTSFRFASTLPALLAAGGVDTVARSRRAAPLLQLPRRRATSAHRFKGREKIGAGVDSDHRTRRLSPQRDLLEPRRWGTRRGSQAD